MDLYHDYTSYAPFVHTTPGLLTYISDLHTMYCNILNVLFYSQFIDAHQYM